MRNYQLLDLEVSLIQDRKVRQLVVDVLRNKVPDYVETAKASSTGKYHPTDELGSCETIIQHTKSVTRIMRLILMNPLYDNEFNEYERDIMISACILHDMCKYGYPDKDTYTCHEHPLIVRELYPYNEPKGKYYSEYYSIFNDVCKLIESHHGEWRESSHSKVKLPAVSNHCQFMVHMADYLASRKLVKVVTLDNDEVKSLL